MMGLPAVAGNEPCVFYLVVVIWFLVFWFLFLVPGSWFLVFGSWFFVFYSNFGLKTSDFKFIRSGRQVWFLLFGSCYLALGFCILFEFRIKGFGFTICISIGSCILVLDAFTSGFVFRYHTSNSYGAAMEN